MKEIKLRPYQEKFLQEVLDEFREGHKNICGVAPCGAGKTVMAGKLIQMMLEQGNRIIFFVHRQELIEQTSKTLTDLGIEHGIILASAKADYSKSVQVASIQTLVRRLNSIPEPDFLICDECHHILANSYKTIINHWHNSLLLGLTATPQRMGGINLGDVFTAMVEAPTTRELIEMGHLTEFEYYAPAESVNLDSVRVKFGEYVNGDLEKVMSGGKIIGNIVENYKKFAAGKSAICYCVNVKHSKRVARAFNAAGIVAEHCDGETNKKVRARIVEDFRLGKIKILCNAELFGEGFDVPNMQAVILARPTKSLTLFTQQSLRPLRPDPREPNKVAVIIDHVKNCDRFGLPDSDRDWTLEPSPEQLKSEKKSAPKKSTMQKICPDCEGFVDASTKICPFCYYDFVAQKSADDEARYIEHEGLLQRIKNRVAQRMGNHSLLNTSPPTKKTSAKKKTSAAKTKSSAAKKHSSPFARTISSPTGKTLSTPEEFLLIAKERNYKIGWVAMRSLQYAESYEDCLEIARVCNYKEGWAWYKWKEIQEAT